MPNQRAKNKVYIGGFIIKDLHKEIVRQAKAAGMSHNKFGFVTQLVERSINRRAKAR